MRPRGFALIYLIAGVAALGILASLYYYIRESGKDAVYLEWSEASRHQRENEERTAYSAASGLEVDRAKTKVIYRNITQRVTVEVEKPVYRNVCLAPGGLCIANAAITGADPAACKPDEPVSGAAPTR